jgi:hypothetical protein
MVRPALLVLLAAAGCNDAGARRVTGDVDSAVGTDSAVAAATVDAGDPGEAGAAMMSCGSSSTDQAGCPCSSPGAMQACYPASADPSTAGVGACMDGTQSCQMSGEFAVFGACTGAVTPVAENCSDHIDNNCDGKTDCADPTCATSPACMTGCTNGQTRPCYDGPSGTLNVGTCRGGTQTCTNGNWPTSCPGEVLPTAENCSDALDHDCNHLPGCLDFACIFTMGCMNSCQSSQLDPGCSCPQGGGDTATCPEGTLGVSKSGGGLFSLPVDECCPCTASDCNNAGCCAEAVCAGNSMCAGLTCKPLPASCNGQVNFDCDDFPEDCDEPCCKCTKCP